MKEQDPQGYGELFRPLADCPPVERLLSESSSAAMRAHAAGCPHCRSELALFRNFAEAAPEPREARDVAWISRRLDRREPRVSWWRKLLAANFAMPAFAAAAVLLVVGAVQLTYRPGAGPAVRISGDEPLRSRSLEVIAPLGSLKEAPHKLSWQPVSGASRYDVRVMEVDRADLWRTTITDNSIELPADVRSKFLPGKRVLWQVTARDARGTEILDSGVQSFAVSLDGLK